MYSSCSDSEDNSHAVYPNEIEERRRRKNAAKWRDAPFQIMNTGRFVFILTFESWNHGMPRGQNLSHHTIGAFDSKEAAIAMAVTFETEYGTFDAAVDQFFDSCYEFIDNRHNPPDNGILMELGGEDVGEGDYNRILINKVEIEGVNFTSANSNHILQPAHTDDTRNKRSRLDGDDPESSSDTSEEENE